MSKALASDHPEVDPVTPDGRHLHPTRPAGEVREMVPTKRRLSLRDVMASGPVMRVMAVRDFKAKYKQSALGPIWLIVQPLGILLAFMVVFDDVAQVGSNGVPYPLFALAGISVWSFFQMAVSLGAQSITGQGSFIRRVNVPRFALPIAAVSTALPVLGCTFAFTLITAFALGEGLPAKAALIPVALVWLVALVTGIVFILSALAVRARDILGMLPFLLQALLFLSPIGYSTSDASSTIATVLAFNPLTGLIDFWRWCLLDGAPLEAWPALLSAGLTTLLLFGGWYVFTRLEVRFADVV